MPLSDDLIAQWLEKPAQEAFTTTTRKHRIFACKGIGAAASSGLSLLRPPNALPNTREIATLRNEEATYGRSFTYWSRVPPCPRSSAITDQPDRIDVEQKRRRTTLRSRFRIEHVRLSKRKLKRMQSRRIFVQQVTQIRRRLIRGCNGQQHFFFSLSLYVPFAPFCG